jgi:hypothetical protein
MTVSQLITKLQTLPASSLILTDMPCTFTSSYARPTDSMIAPYAVKTGIAWKILGENGTLGFYVGDAPWENWPQGQPLQGIPAVYLGSGDGIIGPEWDTV